MSEFEAGLLAALILGLAGVGAFTLGWKLASLILGEDK